MMRISGFYKLSVEERLDRLKKMGVIDDKDISVLTSSMSLDHADGMIENVIGIMHLPFAVATNFVINSVERLIPMAIEEASVVAAASRAAKQTEGFIANSDPSIMIGEIYFKGNKNEVNVDKIIEWGNESLDHLKKYGCKVENVKIKEIQGNKGIIYLYINVGNAQGANMINNTLEYVADKLTPSITPIVKILSNLAIFRKTHVKAVWKKETIGEKTIDAVLEAYRFALVDLYRTVTHNKGIMNGIDAVALATGNDWRSIEAAAHGYAAINYYKPLTNYYKNEEGDLVGEIELPLAVGVVGPAVNSNPLAKVALKLAKVKTSQDLAQVMASAGLANNFAALSALSTEGIQKGHMRLHAKTIAMQAGAKDEKIDKVARELTRRKIFSIEEAKKILEELQ